MKKALVAILAVVVIGGILGVRLMLGQTESTEADNVKRALIGMQTQPLTAADRERLGAWAPEKGVYISVVHPQSLAENAGLSAGDVVVSVNGVAVSTVSEYQAALDNALASSAINFALKRDGDDVQIRVTPEFAATYNNLGAAYVKDARPADAKQAFQKALSIDENFAEAYYNLGNLEASSGNQTAAIEQYNKALKLDPNMQNAYYKLGDAYAAQGDCQKAIDAYKKLIRATPPDSMERGIKPVEVIEARMGEIASEIETTGTIAAHAAVSVFPKVADTIIEFKKDDGDRVKKGDLLAVIEHDVLELQAQQADAGLESATVAHEQAVKLSEIRVRAQAAQARAGLASAEAAMKQVEDLAKTRSDTNIAVAEAGLSAIRSNLDKLKNGARPEEREQIRATVTTAKANLNKADSDYVRIKGLYEQGAVSKQTFEGVETQLEVAQAQLETAQQAWNLVEKGARAEDLRALESQVAQSEAQLNLARRQTQQRTWEQDIAMASAQVQTARAAVTSADALVDAKSWTADIAAAKTGMTQARVQRDLARKRLADAYITAPIDGIVAKRHLDLGGMASMQMPLFDLVQVSLVHATVNLIEDDLPNVRVGNTARLQVKGQLVPFTGQVTSISPIVDPRSRTAEVEITVRNEDGALKPGMFARVLLPTEVRPNAVLVPRDAVLQDAVSGERHVFIVTDGKSQKVAVDFGLERGALVEITGGLQSGARVVYAGQQNLTDGDFVQVVRTVQPF
ncbi:MAG: efflux RND transporter periplasmic adaptor subunit [Candidatus Poribacteria bacterium]|nr:efflux RND transporter periplasmic adaptor subunit [Candidatus Poribacteria bacterium]